MQDCKHEAQGELIVCLHQLAKARQENADTIRLKLRVREQGKHVGEPWTTEARRLYATGTVVSIRSGIEFLRLQTGECFVLQQPTLKWAGEKTPLPDEQSIVHDINQAITELVCAHSISGLVLNEPYQIGIEQALRACAPLVLDPMANPMDLMPLESFNNMVQTAQNRGLKLTKNPCFCLPFVNACVAFQQAWKAHLSSGSGTFMCSMKKYRDGLGLAIQTVAELHLV